MTIETIVFAGAAGFVLMSLAALYRIVVGPTNPDRVIAVNLIGSNVVIVIALITAGIGEPGAIDIAIVYALLNFLLSIAISKFSVERGGVL